MDETFAKVADLGGAFLSEGMMSSDRAMRDVARATHATVAKSPGDMERMMKIRDLLRKVADEIEGTGAAHQGGAGVAPVERVPRHAWSRFTPRRGLSSF